MRNILITLGASMLLFTSALAKDGNKLFEAKTINFEYAAQEPTSYSDLGAVTVVWETVRTGISSEINTIDFTATNFLGLLGKPVLNVWSLTEFEDGPMLTGGGLSWALVEKQDASFRVNFTVGVSFAFATNKIDNISPGVGLQFNWKN